MQPLCDLEEKYGVDLDLGYRNDHACTTFIEYIALVAALNQCNFLASKLIVVLTQELQKMSCFLYGPHSADGKVHVRD